MKKEEILNRLNPLFFKGIAHRGLHNELYPENTLEAFQNAIDNNVAFELDVHLSKDNKLIVSHDSDLERMTGKKGIIEELTLKEIKEEYRIKDKFIIPTLDEVLKLNSERVPLVIELKIHDKNDREITNVLKEYLKDIKDKKNFMIISFYPKALLYVKDLKIVRNLLIQKNESFMYKLRKWYEGIDIETTMFSKKINKYRKKRIVNTYTVKDLDTLNEAIKYTDTVTFERISLSDVRKLYK